MATVSALFKKRSAADKAFDQLEDAGFSRDQISLVMSEDTRNNYIKEIKDTTDVDEGVSTGVSIGGLAGAIAGMLLAAGTITIPGLNLVVAGALVPTLAGLGAGAVTGGIVGGLIGAGIPEHEAIMYAEEIENGNFLVTIQTSTKEEEATAREICSLNSADRIQAAA